ncbi:hypothetical protein JFV28_20565 [Pseudomonas sp. TH05]|uniref:hypothetical protein n=1 Tax=unclassified Pseudomonas TaxID=196821 RepID=UPI001913AEB5|nr:MULTISPECIES: hypothetical protein [unclassified Pseudomonas]MBK5541482.1 hypothetical protein [Pseudomonas sp. TH07]MBK5558239.1 hypothetical protein [Pseudomonas sp. TH05]
MRTVVKLVLFAGVIGCLAWAIIKPGFDSVTAAIMALGTLLATFILDKKTEASQSQNVGANATGIQAGGDVNINK